MCAGGLVHRGGPILEPDASRFVYAMHYTPSAFVGDAPDRRGAGTARQYELEGGLGRFSFSKEYDAAEHPTSLFFGVLPDGSGRAFLRREDGEIQAGVNGEAGINGDDLKQYLNRQGGGAEEDVDVGRHTHKL